MPREGQPSPRVDESFAQLWHAAHAGDINPLRAWASELDSRRDPAHVPADLLVQLMEFGAGLRDAPPDAHTRVAGLIEAPSQVRRVAVAVLGELAMGYALTFDGARLAKIGALVEPMMRELSHPESHAECQLLAAWVALATGTGTGTDTAALADAEHSARQVGRPWLVVRAASLRALLAAEVGEMSDALANARRASRMGRTERLPQAEYLASMALARIRRLNGRPHLATHILTAMARFAPPAWAAWIDWESTMARGNAVTPDGTAPPHLQNLYDALAAADPARVDESATQLSQATSQWFPNTSDWAALAAVLGLDTLRDNPVHIECSGWVAGRGNEHPPPRGLAGLNTLAGADDETRPGPTASVVGGPGLAPQRILQIGVPTMCRRARAANLDSPKPGRAESVLAALVLAGEAGCAEPELFVTAYGFAYSPGRHRGTFDVALHRARERLGALGEVHRSGGQIRLALQRAVTIPDPRTTPAADDRVLAYLARRQQVSAREIARSLGVPLRTVQNSLRDLVDGGACAQQRQGRNVMYEIEDTTFQEPTCA